MIKKISLFLLMLLLFTGCGKLSAEDKLYKQYVEQLQEQEEFDQDFPFHITINIEKLTEYEITYHLVIDNFKEDIRSIQALVIHDQKTEDVYPSVGIFEDKIDLVKEKKKGILLVGYIDYKEDIEDFHGTFKARITYEQEGQKITKYYKKNY